jgi:hypothetical protein
MALLRRYSLNMKTPQAIESDLRPPRRSRLDRRQRDRIALHVQVRVISYGLLAESSEEAVCTDLSEGGVSLETPAELNVGDIVVLEFRMRGEDAYRCQARLTYRMGRRYGANFIVQ